MGIVKYEIETSRKGFANILAKYYSYFYSDRRADEEFRSTTTGSGKQRESRDQKVHTPEITMQEKQIATDCLKGGKAGDKKRIRAEDLEEGDDETKSMMKDIFDEIIKQENMAPDSWKM